MIFFSKSGFPIKKKGDERWKYLDLRSLEKTFYSTDYDNDNLTINFDSIGLDKSNIISVNNGVPKYESLEGIEIILMNFTHLSLALVRMNSFH